MMKSYVEYDSQNGYVQQRLIRRRQLFFYVNDFNMYLEIDNDGHWFFGRLKKSGPLTRSVHSRKQ